MGVGSYTLHYMDEHKLCRGARMGVVVLKPEGRGEAAAVVLLSFGVSHRAPRAPLQARLQTAAGVSLFFLSFFCPSAHRSQFELMGAGKKIPI